MSARYQWSQVIVKNMDAKNVLALRVVIGSYGVGPSMISGRKGGDRFTSDAWSVDERVTGSCIALYSDLKVAIKFAEFCQRTYGNIGAIAQRTLDGQKTPEDSEVLKSLNEKRKHVSFIDPNPRTKSGQRKVKYIPFDPSILDDL